MVSPAADKSYEVQFLELLKLEIPQAEQSVWLDGVHLEVTDGLARVIVPSAPQMEVLRSRWERPIREILRQILPGNSLGFSLEFGLEFTGQSRPADHAAPKELAAMPSPGTATGHPSSSHSENSREALQLRSGFTFDTFIPGPSNHLAHAAAHAVAESPGVAYNPFFIHGSVGLGKTHLLHAIAHQLLAQGHRNIIVTSCASFTNEFIAALSNQKIDQFRHRYRTADALLIDDIQFLSDKERTQEEFFHTFNDIYNREQQIVLTSDAPPKDIAGVSDRLVSRFRLGLVVQLEAPEMETRISILKRKLMLRDLYLEPEVIELIASRISDNVRELEGAVLRIESMVRHEGMEANCTNVQNALHEIFGQETRKLDLGTIEEAVCKYYSVTVEDLRSSRRSRSIVLPRQVSMYLGRQLTGCSLGEIGKHFGGRDHTTVMHSIDKIRGMILKDAVLQRDLETVEASLLR